MEVIYNNFGNIFLLHKFNLVLVKMRVNSGHMDSLPPLPPGKFSKQKRYTFFFYHFHPFKQKFPIEKVYSSTIQDDSTFTTNTTYKNLFITKTNCEFSTPHKLWLDPTIPYFVVFLFLQVDTWSVAGSGRSQNSK